MEVAVVREIILYGQGYGAIKTWEKKIFYDLLWPNEISDLNNFNTEDFPRLFFTATYIQAEAYKEFD